MIKFLKVRDVKSPVRTQGNAGIDFFVPNYTPDFVQDLREKNLYLNSKVIAQLKEKKLRESLSRGEFPQLTDVDKEIIEGPQVEIKFNDNGEAVIPILPHRDILIPSGIKAYFDDNLALVAFNKSGQATKKKLDIGACVIDSSYRGEIHLHITNTSNHTVYITFGEKLVQFLPLHINTEELAISGEETDEEEFYGKDLHTEREGGGFGSSGIK